MNLAACPTNDRWSALLAEDVTSNDAAELEAHLATCARCRETLDSEAVGRSGWLRDASRLAARDQQAPELTLTLERLVDVRPDEEGLSFLKPSTLPGVIGTLGRYQVLSVLGRGAMAVVLKALDPDLLRPVAIKVMAAHLAHSAAARQRFQREARAAAAVSHDHVVAIHSVEQIDGVTCLVMEYAAGGTLQDRLDAEGALPYSEATRIGLQAARGLAAAHAQGLVHRDVKPANILLESAAGRVKLSDFGLARAADDVRLTQSGVAAGTPLYMSPEQARGETVDHRSDLFSLGSVLYALLTGSPPFRASTTMGVLNRITNDPPRRIREINPEVPAGLENIVMQLLEKNPARRVPSAAEVADRLTASLADPMPSTRRVRRRWLILAIEAAAIIIAGVVLTFKTPHGTLVVEVDDPAVRVTLDDQELSITGAGPQEVRLKPGAYRVAASREGKPVKLSTEIVNIVRDGKTIVKVAVEPVNDANQTAPKVAGFEKYLDQFQRALNEQSKKKDWRFLLTAPPMADAEKISGLSGEELKNARSILAKRDAIALLVPRIQILEAKLKDEKAKSPKGPAVDALEAQISTQTRLLQEMIEEFARFDQPRPVDTVEVAFRKVMKEYDELCVRVAPTSLGRLLALFPENRGWGDSELQLHFGSGNKEQIAKARQMLTLRDQIYKQATEARQSFQSAELVREAIRRDPLAATDAWRDELNRDEQRARFRTATIEGLVADLKKLMEPVDPTKMAPNDEVAGAILKLRETAERLKVEIAQVERNLVRAEETLASHQAALQANKLEPEQRERTAAQIGELRKECDRLKAQLTAHRTELASAEDAMNKLGVRR